MGKDKKQPAGTTGNEAEPTQAPPDEDGVMTTDAHVEGHGVQD
jgi:hypothetical protein